ncbi:MAG: response regulator [Candidatus Omnitrophota bacterium]
MPFKNRILICDDEEGVRESLRLILEKDYNLIFANSGEMCLEMLQCEKEINLVLIDIKMPKINGIEVMREIKKTYPGLPIIVVTGYKSSEIAQEATEAGACEYIVKPFDSKELIKCINIHII